LLFLYLFLNGVTGPKLGKPLGESVQYLVSLPVCAALATSRSRPAFKVKVFCAVTWLPPMTMSLPDLTQAVGRRAQ
jgi:hypothetical protein